MTLSSQWERKALCAGLRHNVDDDTREALYAAWGINRASKERKLQLVQKVSRDVTCKDM